MYKVNFSYCNGTWGVSLWGVTALSKGLRMHYKESFIKRRSNIRNDNTKETIEKILLEVDKNFDAYEKWIRMIVHLPMIIRQ